MDFADKLVGKGKRSDAFRAVARAGARNKQRRRLCLQIEAGRAHEIGGGDCFDPAWQGSGEMGRETFPDKSGRTGPGHDHAHCGAIQQRPNEALHGVVLGNQPRMRLAQHRGLLGDLACGCERAQRLQLAVVAAEPSHGTPHDNRRAPRSHAPLPARPGYRRYALPEAPHGRAADIG